jgi:glutaredoxin
MKKRNVLAMIIFIMGFASYPIQAQIYSWVDEKGIKHYSDTPPENRSGIKDLKTVDLSSDAESTESQPAEKPSLLPSSSASPVKALPSVVMYTTSWCGYCKKAKAWMIKNKVPFKEYDIETSAQNKANYKKAGGSGVPLIFIGQNRLSGWDEATARGWIFNQN